MQTQPAYIVDDSTDHRFLVKYYFKMFWPEQPVELFDGARALFTRLSESGTAPFVIVLDLEMPEMDGYEILQLLKGPKDSQNSWWKTVPVILNSSLATEEMMRKCREAGASAFLVKSTDQHALINMLKSVRSGDG